MSEVRRQVLVAKLLRSPSTGMPIYDFGTQSLHGSFNAQATRAPVFRSRYP